MLNVSGILAQSSSFDDIAQTFYLVVILLNIVSIAMTIAILAGAWATFKKAGHPGWAAIIPFYNFFVTLRIAGRPGWWLLLLIIPFVNIVVIILVSLDLARQFGKGTGFGLGLTFLPFIFFPVLGFGNAAYRAAPAHMLTPETAPPARRTVSR